jgi:G3E family GTPase
VLKSQQIPSAVITVVDAKHIIQHLDEVKPEGAENEAVEQIAFADRVLLNKTDLASEPDLLAVEQRIRAINAAVGIVRTQLRPAGGGDPALDLGTILEVDAFSLPRILEAEPDFLSESGQEHQHDASVGSVGLRLSAEMNKGKLQEWIHDMMQEKGPDLYRYKVRRGPVDEPWPLSTRPPLASPLYS